MRAFETVVRLRGVRVAVVVVAVYALFLLVIPQSSPQAIDAILAWSSHPSYVLADVDVGNLALRILADVGAVRVEEFDIHHARVKR